MMKYLLPPAALVAGYYVLDYFLIGEGFGYWFWNSVVPWTAVLTLALWWRPKSR